MTLKEIRELLVLTEWTREELAARLCLQRNTIDKWFCAKVEFRRYPSAEHVSKMRAWLTESRSEARKQPV